MNKQYLIDLLVNTSLSIFAIWIFSRPDIGLDLFRFYFGIILILGAVSLYIVYRNKSDKKLILFQSAILLLIGLVFLVSPSLSAKALALLLVAWMVYEIISNIMLALTYRKFSINFWPVLIVFALIYAGMVYFILQDLNLTSALIIKFISLLVVARSLLNIIDTIAYKKLYTDSE